MLLWHYISATLPKLRKYVLGRGKRESVVADKKLPSKLQMAKNVIKSAAKNVKSIVDGNDLQVNQTDFEIRLGICSDCELFVDERCAECGCFLNIKAKLFAEECPLGMWPPVIADEIVE